MQLSPITAVVEATNETQLLFIISRHISAKNLHSHKLESVW